MLRSLKSLENYSLQATDGELGSTKDFYFDDDSWTLRYAVVDTGRWLPGKRVLISPHSFLEPQWEDGVFPTRLTMNQVREAPTSDQDLPISRQYEAELASHFAWPVYWGAPAGMVSPAIASARVYATNTRAHGEESFAEIEAESNLRSAREVRGYDVRALDGETGSVSDLIVDTQTWQVRYLVVDTRKWLPGGKLLLSVDWIDTFNWNAREARVGLKEEDIKACPAYDPSHGVNREYEARIYDYYGRPRYWA